MGHQNAKRAFCEDTTVVRNVTQLCIAYDASELAVEQGIFWTMPYGLQELRHLQG